MPAANRRVPLDVWLWTCSQTQRTARHPVHRNELCVHPPAPALLSAAPFHLLVLQSFSLVTSTQKRVSPVGHLSTDCTVASSASAGPVLWEMGSLCLTGSSPKATSPGWQGHTSMGWLRDSSGDRCGTLGVATATLHLWPFLRNF